MAEGQGRKRQLLEALHVQLGVADPASFHAHQRLARPGLAKIDGVNPDRTSRVGKNRRLSMNRTHGNESRTRGGDSRGCSYRLARCTTRARALGFFWGQNSRATLAPTSAPSPMPPLAMPAPTPAALAG